MTPPEFSLEPFASIIGDRVSALRTLHAENDSVGNRKIDCAVAGLDPLWPLRLTGGWKLCQCLHDDAAGWSWVLKRDGEVVALKTLDDPRGVGQSGFPSVLALGGPGNLANSGARAAYLTIENLRNGWFSDAEWMQIQALAREDPEAYVRALGSVFGTRSARELLGEVLTRNAPRPAVSHRARRAKRLRRLRAPRLILPFVFLEARRRLEHVVRRTGLFVLVVGPDGSGKSTLASMLPEASQGLFRSATRQHFRPGVLPRPGALLRKGKRDWSAPHAAAPHGRPISLLLLTYFWLDFLIGALVRTSPLRARTKLVVAERGWWDLVVDPKRYRLQVPVTLVRVLGRFLPRPDLVLLLEAPAKTIVQRKDELSPAEVERQLQAWHDVVPGNAHRAYIDTSRPIQDVVTAAKEEVVGILEARAMSRVGSGWMAVPRPGRGARTATSPDYVPRLILPRGPRAAVRASLRAYYPCTRRGRGVWEAARLVATLGGFRLVRRGEAPPPAVREILAPHLPPRSTYALAESNHPGRFIAVIVGERGDCHALAKIATDPHGRLALEREARALQSLGRLLPPPLGAPQLLNQTDGLLLLEPVPWLPRRRPWFLPTEIVRALGTFFGAASEDGERVGPMHGDFAPWNLLQTRRGWVLVDWEEAHDKGRPFFDLFHYLVMANLALGRPSQRALLDGLEGKGWVGRTIAVYAESAKLDNEDTRELLISYLRASSEGLNLATPGGLLDFQGRQGILKALEG